MPGGKEIWEHAVEEVESDVQRYKLSHLHRIMWSHDWLKLKLMKKHMC